MSALGAWPYSRRPQAGIAVDSAFTRTSGDSWKSKAVRNSLVAYLTICTTTIKRPSGCGAVGSARHLGCWGRRFEPCHSDHIMTSHLSECGVRKTPDFSGAFLYLCTSFVFMIVISTIKFTTHSIHWMRSFPICTNFEKMSAMKKRRKLVRLKHRPHSFLLPWLFN